MSILFQLIPLVINKLHYFKVKMISEIYKTTFDIEKC